MISSLSAALAKLTVILALYSTALAATQTSTISIIAPTRPTTAQIYAWVPLLYDIAACESSGAVSASPRQFNANGSILWGQNPKLWDITRATTTDVGELQISLTYHGPEIKTLGLDVINSESDNVYYGYLLYQKYGSRPWDASKGCWGPKRRS